MRRRTAFLLVVAMVAPMAGADLCVEPQFLEAHHEYIHIRQPGTPDSGSSRRTSSQPAYGSAAASRWTGRGSSYWRTDEGVSYEFFADTDGRKDQIAGSGYGATRLTLVDDDADLTMVTAASRTTMSWEVVDPVMLHLRGLVRISGTRAIGDGEHSAQAGVRLRGSGEIESARLDQFADEVLSFDWTVMLEPDWYTLEAWAAGLSVSQAADADLRSTASYSFTGDFIPVPAPGGRAMCAAVLLASGGPRRRRSRSTPR